jgi:hypothetical protein
MKPYPPLSLDLPESPELAIQTVRAFIRELSYIQGLYQDTLEESLNLTPEGKVLLHEFIHNSEDEDHYLSFEEFASFLGKTSKDLYYL